MVMHIKGKYSWMKHIDFMLIDLFAFLSSFLLAYFIKFHTISISSHWASLVVIPLLFDVVITLLINPYSGMFRRRFFLDIGHAAIMTGLNALFLSFILFASKTGASYSREVIFLTFIFYFCLSLVFKYIWKRLLLSGTVRTSTTKLTSLFVVSDPDNAMRVVRNVEAGELPILIIQGISIIPKPDRRGEELFNAEFLESLTGQKIPVIRDNYVDYILKNGINEVLIATDIDEIDKDGIKKLIENGISVNLGIESLLGFSSEEQYVTNVGVYKALNIGAFSLTPGQNLYLAFKRICDIACSLIGIVFLLPITIVVKLINISSGDTAKVFYRQNRIGLNGKPIRIWKYRTMVPNAEEILEEMLKEEKWRTGWDEKQKFDNDPRITKVGRFLRKTSIDELPQLINVLLGDMSLVGPRPLVEGELEQHNGLKIYNRVKPGITGWWGCNGRSNIDYQERLELEYYYVKNCGLFLDVLCIIKTAQAVLKKDGAK